MSPAASFHPYAASNRRASGTTSETISNASSRSLGRPIAACVGPPAINRRGAVVVG